MDSKKESFFKDFSTLIQGKSSEEILPLMLALSQKAKKEKIEFTKEDIAGVYESMKNTMSPEEAKKAEALLNMYSIL